MSVYYESDAHAVSPLLDLENPGSEIFLGTSNISFYNSNCAYPRHPQTSGFMWLPPGPER